MTFQQPDYVPGLANAAPDDLVRMVDADPAPSPLLSALAESLAGIAGEVAAAEAQLEKIESEYNALETERDDLADQLEAEQDAADDFRELLREAADALAAGRASDNPDEADAGLRLIEEIWETLAAHPSRGEIAAAERKAKAQQEEDIAWLTANVAGYAEALALEKPRLARLEYKVPRGRKWHRTGMSCYVQKDNAAHWRKQVAILQHGRPGLAARVVTYRESYSA